MIDLKALSNSELMQLKRQISGELRSRRTNEPIAHHSETIDQLTRHT